MTAQIPERLVYKDGDFKLCSEPLEAYFQVFGYRNLRPTHTACRRGYVGTWEIKEDKLYLAEIRIGNGRPRGKIMSAEERELYEALDEDNEYQLTPETLFSGQSLPIFAYWFTGILRLVQGKATNYVHGGYESTFAHEFLLRVENGVVISELVESERPRL